MALHYSHTGTQTCTPKMFSCNLVNGSSVNYGTKKEAQTKVCVTGPRCGRRRGLKGNVEEELMFISLSLFSPFTFSLSVPCYAG